MYINRLYFIIILVIAELVVYFTNREIKNIVWKTRSAKALNSFQPFKNKLFNQLLYIINSVDLYKDKNTSIYEKVSNFIIKFNFLKKLFYIYNNYFYRLLHYVTNSTTFGMKRKYFNFF